MAIWAVRPAWSSIEWVPRPVSPDVKELERGVGQSHLNFEEVSIFTSVSRMRYHCVVFMRGYIAPCTRNSV